VRSLITGIGQLVSGDIAAPLLDADSIAIVDGRISAVGWLRAVRCVICVSLSSRLSGRSSA